MATYDAGGYWSYSGSAGLATYSSSTGSGVNLDDGEANGTFEVGDILIGSDNAFVGTIEVPLVAGGTMWLPVTHNGTFSHIWIPEGMNLGDFDEPRTFRLLDLNTSDFPTCFLEGTGIDTPEGTVAVQDLEIGQVICTATGTTKVRWIGRQTLFPRFQPAERVRPVRLCADALGRGVPRRDLLLTADHALHIDGLLINASALVNGTSILWEPIEALGDSYTIYHVETEAHELILAEGAEAESYIDYVARSCFDNYAEYLELYGADTGITEMDLPRLSAARLMPESVRVRLEGLMAA
ncbi:hypothetical protein CDZ98_13285 [Mameliella alba]|nr:hypothetical protein CDZ98_13285 [Mameliella alba]